MVVCYGMLSTRTLNVWRSSVRRVWGLPYLIHCAFIPLITGHPPVYDKIVKRMLSFIRSCLLSDNQLVNYATRHAVWHGLRLSGMYFTAVDDMKQLLRTCGQ